MSIVSQPLPPTNIDIFVDSSQSTPKPSRSVPRILVRPDTETLLSIQSAIPPLPSVISPPDEPEYDFPDNLSMASYTSATTNTSFITDTDTPRRINIKKRTTSISTVNTDKLAESPVLRRDPSVSMSHARRPSRSDFITISKRTVSLHPSPVAKSPQKKESLLGGLLESISKLTFEDKSHNTKASHGPKSHLAFVLESQNQNVDNDLLAQLETANRLLERNPRSITLADSAIRVHSKETLRGLKSLDDEEMFWADLVDNSREMVAKIPALVTVRVRSGIPDGFRGRVWAKLSSADVERWKDEYPRLLEADAPFERIIQRDVPRTFPSLEMFKDVDGKGQKLLYSLLRAYSVYDPEMDEATTFAVLVRLMESTTTPTLNNYNMRTLFTPQMQGLHMLLHVHSVLVSRHLPNLHAHFEKHGVTPTMYASPWFLTLFAYSFPLEYVLRIMDVVFVEGARDTLVLVSLAVLARCVKRVTAVEDLEDVLGELKGSRLIEMVGVEELIKEVGELRAVVDSHEIDKICEEYLSKQGVEERGGEEVLELRALRALVVQLRRDVAEGYREIQDLKAANSKLIRERDTVLNKS
ncbi:ecotropic viral integration site [Nowakowskiella sp. JEL0078]|nr:ecotropic viral integration site [Nowakowskiella sp. JEL0078]